ncbi:DNA damage-inducible protein 1 [Hondaea fermentalgiana]|uniref:DNA damage-inducible protein 1 n=1 Tax=Hondaea fermentalgiana TaxID=2315210 RepID=A0A2R5GSV5_9STRA|nr:DNA damage-inducible protein 1 [Hondaea fermentalgiana]|eukprot:GBG33942.1 DNA damage-inducible protein 1 [Hondaea fermentalgiana]
MQLTFSADGRVESLELGDSMALSEVRGFVEALLGVPQTDMVLVVNGRVLPTEGSLSSAGLQNNDFVLVTNNNALHSQQQQQGRQGQQQSSSSAAALPQRQGLSLPAGASPPTSSGARGASAGLGASLGQAGAQASGPVFWEGMSVDEVMAHNTNPAHIVDILQANPKVLQELNFHNEELAAHMRKDRATAVRELRTFMMMNATESTIAKLTSDRKDREMEARLRTNPMDEEANKYFGEKIQKERIQEQYMQMMQYYPESLSRVLMLYIEVEINGVALQAFVDSGAQSSVMSGKCAEKCNLYKDIDKRFAGQVVGVGTGRTLGRVHLAMCKIGTDNFTITLTVMDDSQGLGDSNMEMLLGLDMLKRHRCSIDLADGKLYFEGASGRVSTPFLHEKDLPETKGGTLGYNPNKQPNSDEAGEGEPKSSAEKSS